MASRQFDAAWRARVLSRQFRAWKGLVKVGSNVLRIGNVEVTAVIDAEARDSRRRMFPAVPEEDWAPYVDQLVDDGRNVPLTMSCHLVRSAGMTILVDTGIGGKQRPNYPQGRLPDALAEAGVGLDEIDIVVATHIHIDHVGWHTTVQGEAYVPTFRNARYVFNRAEWEFFTSSEEAARPEREYVRDSVLPLTDVANIELVDEEHRLTDDLTLLPTPGHTPGHVSIAIASAGEAGVIIGDVCHHPAQIAETGWSPVYDMNPSISAQSRESLMAKVEAEGMTVLAGHFATPGFGRIVRVEGRRSWVAL